MNGSARHEAAAFAAGNATDPATLRRVHAALLGQLGGTLPALPVQEGGPAYPAGYLERRTFTPLRHVRGGQP
ncbi:MAG TPA: hypothetical protein VN969_35480 [Streptosporangiaceae bacterium]|nr:hypothetical protein [Streptosporangiaceae bacterium]